MASSNKTKYHKKQKNSSSIKWLFKTGIKVGFYLFLLLLIMMAYYAYDLPDISKIEKLTKQREITFITASGEVLTRYGDKYAEFVGYERLPKNLKEALLATEDRRFYYHFGVDPIGITRAIYVNATKGRFAQGGSTITQQLAKIVFLSPERTMRRKVQELMLAFYLEYKYTKNQIMTIYLNRVYMGSGIYGVGAASKYYFGKPIEKVSLQEAAIITGLLQAPSRYSPVNNADLSGKRAYQVLENMLDAGYISADEFEKASTHPVTLDTSALGSSHNMYFASWVVDNLGKFTKDDESDLVVTVTVNPKLQEYAASAVGNALQKYGKEKDVGQAALVAMTPEGAILAMIGGDDFNKSPFNRAVQAERQAGSAFKPFVYAALFENTSYQPDSMTEDREVKVGKWKPRNYTREFLGDVTVREAFARSINTTAVALSEMIGRGSVIDLATHMGITSKLEYNPSIALGAAEVNLLDMTTAYASFPNHGKQVIPYGVLKIETKKGKPLYRHFESEGDYIMSSSTVSFMNDLMIGVIELPYGTGKSARLSGRTAAGKTGTTSDYRDAWFMGYTGDLVAGVWVGNDDNHPMKKVVGGTVPAAIWKEFMNNAETQMANIDISVQNFSNDSYEGRNITETDTNPEITVDEPLEPLKLDPAPPSEDQDEGFWNKIENMLD